jgi:hypothetical protein
MGFFNNTSDVDLGSELPVVDVPLDDAEAERARELDRKIATLWRDIWSPVGARLQNDADWAAAAALEARTSNTTEVEVIDVEGAMGYRTVGNVARGTTVILQAELPNTIQRVTAIRFTGYPEDLQQALLDSEWGYVLSHVQVRVLPAEGEPREVKIGFVVADEVDPLLDPLKALADDAVLIHPDLGEAITLFEEQLSNERQRREAAETEARRVTEQSITPSGSAARTLRAP